MKRSQQKVSETINVSPEAAWEVIGAVKGVDNWFAPMITSCRVEGDKRICGTDAGEFTEDIYEVNHKDRTLKYGIPSQPLMPVENILGSMQILSTDDNKAIIEWRWDFDVAEDHEAEAKEMLSGALQMGIKGIETYINSN